MAIQENDNQYQSMKMLFYLGIIFSLPIIFTNSYYMDDNLRAIYGYTWSKSGRLFSTVLMNVLDLHVRDILDLAPLGQILGILALAYAGLVLTRRLTGGTSPDRLTLCLCGLPLLVQPFMLENLSYKFDALPMLLAQACATLAVSTPIDWTKRQGIAYRALLVFAVMAFYQPALNTFMALSLIVFLCDCQRGQYALAWKTFGQSLLGAAIAAVIYHFAVTPYFVRGPYEAPHAVSATLHGLSISSVMQNLAQGLPLLKSLFVHGGGILLIGWYILGTVAAALTIRTCMRHRSRASIAAAFLIACMPVLIPGTLSGIMLLLSAPVYEPRTLMSFSACVIFSNLFFCRFKTWRWVGLAPVLYFYVLSYTYGNALREDTRFQAAQIEQVASALDLQGFSRGDNLFIYGNEERSPIVQNAISVFPLMGRLLPRQGLHEDDIFGYTMLNNDGIVSRNHTEADWMQARQLLQPQNIVLHTEKLTLYRRAHTFCLLLANSSPSH